MNTTPIAIIGMSGIFPDSPSVAAFWRHVCAGSDLLSPTPETHWLASDYCNPDLRYNLPHAKGGFLAEMDFDPVEFGIPPKLLPSTDTLQLLSLLAFKTLWDNLASVQAGKVDAQDISCILGVATGTEMIGEMAAKLHRGNWLSALRSEGIPET